MRSSLFVAPLVAAASALLGSESPAATARGPLAPSEIDQIVSHTMTAFSVPGIAVGVVKDGKLVYARGFGVRELGHSAAVDVDTAFAIGSNTKAFTTAALALLVDEGKLKWDDRVVDILPDFRMSDPYVTREFTVRDLLTHRSGLGLGAGDLMFVPATDFTRQDIIHALRFLKPVSSFRSQFAYDNLLYVVAGEVIRVASGQSWEDFVTSRLLGPVGMNTCAIASGLLSNRSNIAAPHAIVDGQLQRVARLEIPLVAPAGAIQCNVSGMARWMAMQLAGGRLPSGTQLISQAQHDQMWTPQTLLASGGTLAALTREHFSAYGLGWGLDDFDGYKRVSHNGGLPGMVTHVGMLPELGVGVVVLTNQQEGFALYSIAMPILEAYAGAPRRDWVALMQSLHRERLRAQEEADKSRNAPAPTTALASQSDLAAYAGTFADPWRGDAIVSRTDAGLLLTFTHTSGLSGPMIPAGPDFFVARWTDRTLNADAYVRFARGFDGQVSGFTMRAVSATTDFSFDFQDLDFTRVRPASPSPAH